MAKPAIDKADTENWKKVGGLVEVRQDVLLTHPVAWDDLVARVDEDGIRESSQRRGEYPEKGWATFYCGPRGVAFLSVQNY